jgi:hypothetical protein
MSFAIIHAKLGANLLLFVQKGQTFLSQIFPTFALPLHLSSTLLRL